MHKVVYNSEFGGFGLSDEAINWLLKKGSTHVNMFDQPSALSVNGTWEGPRHGTWEGPRHDPLLVECVETLGTKANGSYSHLNVSTISGNYYKINEYDGSEGVEEPSDTEWVDARDDSHRLLVYCEKCTTIKEIIE